MYRIRQSDEDDCSKKSISLFSKSLQAYLTLKSYTRASVRHDVSQKFVYIYNIPDDTD